MSRLPESPSELNSCSDGACVVLHWIPLGAGGSAAVRVSGRIYEAVGSFLDGRRPRPLYHSALEVHLTGERYVIENAWPSPDGDTSSRGVVLEGPVWSPRLCRFRLFRYEVRCWEDGSIPDIEHAVASPILRFGSEFALRILGSTDSIPRHIWGRKLRVAGEMWTSNSVISYLLTVSGLTASDYRPPDGGRAPGWDAGIRIGWDRAPVQTVLGGRPK